MCELGFHVCPDCGEEYKCNQPNSKCPVMNHYDGPCAKCEWWIDQEHTEQQKHDRLMWERQQWEAEHGCDK